ncbi:MAG TPA: hypothetical protein VE870_17355, partial [Bacteroidales bacterium]|nr:hypothetical protein [Bacteroidales bacterium]
MKQQKERTFLQDLLDFQGSLNGMSKYLDEVRLKGADGVRNTPFPTKKLEDWKFISLRDLYSDDYTLVSDLDLQADDFSEHFLPESEGSRLVFVNGSFSEEYSSTENLPDELVIGNIASLAAEDNELLEKHLNKYLEANFEDDVFSHFNCAFLKDGAFIYVPEDVTVEAPVHL